MEVVAGREIHHHRTTVNSRLAGTLAVKTLTTAIRTSMEDREDMVLISNRRTSIQATSTMVRLLLRMINIRLRLHRWVRILVMAVMEGKAGRVDQVGKATRVPSSGTRFDVVGNWKCSLVTKERP